MSFNLNQTRSGSNQLTQKANGDEQFHYVCIIGPGRSGTTWLGQIMNTYEHCSYKYEPFLRSKSTPYRDWMQDLESSPIEELRHRFQSLCRQCYHEIDLPPFPAKSFRWQSPTLLHLLYGLGKRVDPLKSFYEWYGQTRLTSKHPILIKDVNFPNDLLPRLCEVLQPTLIAMIRNPFGRIASGLKGVEIGVFQQAEQSQKINNLRQKLNTPSGKFLSQYCDQLEDMSNVQLGAVIWRLQVEPLVEFARSYERGLVVVYEDLCTDPQGKVSEIFDFVGWRLDQPTLDFLNQSTAGEHNSFNQSKAYYSVYRDPRKSMSKWKTQLTAEQKADIASVIRESPLKDLWSDLPI
ncbi:MAG: sulfotransferase domain-containing protein [Coleofasciculus sp. G3-WIS-01]|uniref:sulfotransferase domain-containing protein n=1 Tax=Coleofasciculus sp. G3-WIS-01 TaxID=3069528 RepID=UPI0032FC051C